jgi:uncharacterized protein
MDLIQDNKSVMATAARDFQVFVKPGGAACNLACDYCYYRSKGPRAEQGTDGRMRADLLETYIRQQIEASPTEVIRFSWHGGEPTLVGLDFFRHAVALQHQYRPAGRSIQNGIQTNGTLLDEAWCRFLAEENFIVGLSLDGPADIHDRHRRMRGGGPTFERVMRGFDLLQIHGIRTHILAVVTARSVREPERLYRFFRRLGAEYLCWLPLVERRRGTRAGVSADSVPAEALGRFLCTIFDEWKGLDIGRIQIEIFEAAVRTAFGQEPAVCVFRPVCGDVPVLEGDGDLYACDHFVDRAHWLGNIRTTPLGELLDSPRQRAFGRLKQEGLPRSCRVCEVLAICNGGCPKERFDTTPDGEPGLNYLCAAYKAFFNHAKPFIEALAVLQGARSATEV